MDKGNALVDKHRKRSRRSNHEGSVVKRKDGRFQASVMVNGKRTYYYSWKKSDCLDWLAGIRIKIMQNEPITDDVTVCEWGQHYIDVYAEKFVRPSTLANYRYYLERHIASSMIANIKLSKLTADHVQMFVNGLRRLDNGQELKAHTVRNIWQFLSGMLERAVDNGLMTRNVAANTKLRKPDAKKRPILTEDDVQKLIHAADGHKWQIGIEILVEGLRISELLALRHSSIITEDGIRCLNITQALKRQYISHAAPGQPKTKLCLAEPKTDSSVRKIPVLPSIMERLEKHMKMQLDEASRSYGLYQKDPFIIGSDLGEMIDQGTFRDFFIKVAEKAGLPEVRPHDLRHFAASQMIRQGASPVGAGRVLGDLPQTTLNVYCQESVSGKLDALMKLNSVTETSSTQLTTA